MNTRPRNREIVLGLAVVLVAFAFATVGCRAGQSRREKATVPSGPPALKLVDEAPAGGLDHRFRIAGQKPIDILQGIGNGCAFLDFDNDGHLDILLVDNPPVLYRGDGAGKWVDVTQASGLARLRGRFLGCAVGDIDNDHDPDIYLSGWREGRLLRNDNGRFADVSRQWGITPQPWGTAASFADFDNDGFLDLFVGNYVRFDPAKDRRLCDSGAGMSGCGPTWYTPVRGVFHRNVGGKRFVRADDRLGLESTSGGILGCAFLTREPGTAPILAIANDERPGDLLVDNGTGTCGNIGMASGMALTPEGAVYGGMGVDWGDFDNDLDPDLFVATFQNEMNQLFRNEGELVFRNDSARAGVALPTPHKPQVAFGCRFTDLDNDGWLDLVIANGHIRDNVDSLDPTTSFRQVTEILRNNGGSAPTFRYLSGNSGTDADRRLVGRGLAVGDVDNDGRPDVLVVDSDGAPVLLRNRTEGTGNWLGLRLRGVRSNRDGVGAVVTVHAGGKQWRRWCRTDGSFLSASDPRLMFGVGDATSVDRVVVEWPSGVRQELKTPPIGRYVDVVEPVK